MIGAALLGLLLASSGPAQAASVSKGKHAYEQNRIPEAERLFAAIEADKGASPADRSAASRELARIAWLIDGKAGAALHHLALAEKAGDEPCDTGLLTIRVLREAERAAEAIGREDAVLSSCDDPAKHDQALLQLIRARLDLAAASSAKQKALFAEAARELAKLGPDAAASLDGARMRLEIGILTGNPEVASKGWREYFWLTDQTSPQALGRFDAAALFGEALRPGSTGEARLALADLLMRAGFAQESWRYAAASGLPATLANNPTWLRFSAYQSEKGKLDTYMVALNRGLARLGKNDAAYRDTQLKQLDRMVVGVTNNLLGAAGVRSRITTSATTLSEEVRGALLENYGIYGTGAGRTGDYPSLHLGHAVEDRRQQVEQYGRSADIRLLMLDNMISNGFETWLWDGGPGVGGWSSGGVIVQVRPRYMRAPLGADALRADAQARRDLLAKQAQRSAEDLASLKNSPVATLEGLNDRLKLQFIDRIEAAARAKAGEKGDLRRAFLDEYWRANIQDAIFIHEGRHAIDQAAAADPSKLDPTTLEYHAKLSQLSLADYPRMALAAIDRGIDGTSPHDRAGTRIMVEYSAWIRANPAQILGYDPAIPAQAQLDKLTDNQIREIARGLDPLAKAAVNSSGGSQSGKSSRQ